MSNRRNGFVVLLCLAASCGKNADVAGTLDDAVDAVAQADTALADGGTDAGSGTDAASDTAPDSASDAASGTDADGAADSVDAPDVSSAADIAPDVSPDTGPACACGDNQCAASCGENLATCPVDCALCGDGKCSAGEGPQKCPEDCCGTCGDGKCVGYNCQENATTCPQDCGESCGNGTCDKGENPTTCPEDCKHKTCGNGTCEPEDGGPAACPQDCGTACGNCKCDKGEDWTNCPVDCGFCGDQVCSACAESGETPATCPTDCKAGQCAPGMGGQCDDGNGCTTDSCTAGGACLHALNTAPCDDGSACTLGDHCGGGACLPGSVTLSCDDGEVCTADSCSPLQGCQHQKLTANKCDDGNACTLGDQCVFGACKGGLPPDCDDLNPCTTDVCDPFQGCVHTGNAAVCSDGSACTDGDGCIGGACVPGPELDCDDGNPCTADTCSAKKGCQHAAVTVPCDDGNACTTGDLCLNAACQPGSAVVCDDGDPCTVDSCAANTGCIFTANPPSCSDQNPCTADSCQKGVGCVHLAQAGTCSDADPCTSGDVCNDGVCQGGGPTACDDGNPCTDDSCDAKKNPTLGCIHAANGAACDDGNVCTLGDTCKLGACQATGVNPCTDGDPCTADSCDPGSGMCGHVAVSNCGSGPCASDADCGTGHCNTTTWTCHACVQNSQCPGGNVCVAGTCAPGIACASVLACKAKGMVCDASAGHCVACLTAGDCGPGHRCAGNVCVPTQACAADKDCPAVCAQDLGFCAECNTWADCAAGWCGVDHVCRPFACTASSCLAAEDFTCKPDGSSYVHTTCADSNLCTTDVCAPGGCAFLPNSVSCTDGNACTIGDACSGGSCAPGKASACDDGNPCTDDACDLVSGGCTYNYNSHVCSDGNACTSGETCKSGKCTGGLPISCNDANDCTDDSCAKASGCIHVPNSGGCDARVCTTGDVCKAGVCVSSGVAALWTYDFGDTSTASAWASGIVAESDGGFTFAGARNSSQIAHIERVSPSGVSTWTWESGSGNYHQLWGLVRNTDGSVVAAGHGAWNGGDDAALVGILADGTAVSGQPTAEDNWHGFLAVTAAIGGYYACGWNAQTQSNQDDLFVQRLDGGFNNVWAVTSGQNSTEYATACLADLASGGVFAVGVTNSVGAGKYDGYVARWSAGGAYLGDQAFGGPEDDRFSGLARAPGGGFLAVGYTSSSGAGGSDAWIVRFDASATLLWQRTYGGASDDSFAAATALPDGGYLLVGTTNSSGAGSSDLWLVRIDDSGNTLWQRTQGGAWADSGGGVTPLVGGGFGISGSRTTQLSGLPVIGWTLRTDDWGNATCGATGQCMGVRASDCDDQNPCTRDYCDPNAGCLNLPWPDGTPCADHSQTCKAGVCG